MARHYDIKLNLLKLNLFIETKQKSEILTSAELRKRGISRQLVNNYKKTGWLMPIGKGAYILPKKKVDWSSGVAAIQKDWIHVGGKSALQILGYSHFLPMNRSNQIYIFGFTGVKLPTWFHNYKWGNPINYTTTNFLPGNLGLMYKEYNNHLIRISTVERAILELLHRVPQDGTVEEADLLIEGLTTLRPSLLQQLLEKCTSIKVKRLFLFLAERHNLSWLKKLNLKKINLGKGKRSIVKNGCLDIKYQITIPKKFYN